MNSAMWLDLRGQRADEARSVIEDVWRESCGFRPCRLDVAECDGRVVAERGPYPEIFRITTKALEAEGCVGALEQIDAT